MVAGPVTQVKVTQTMLEKPTSSVVLASDAYVQVNALISVPCTKSIDLGITLPRLLINNSILAGIGSVMTVELLSVAIVSVFVTRRLCRTSAPDMFLGLVTLFDGSLVATTVFRKTRLGDMTPDVLLAGLPLVLR